MTVLGNFLELNIFSQQAVRGLEDLKPNMNKIAVKIAENSNVLSAGDMVKITEGNSAIPTITEIESTDVNSTVGKVGFIPLGRLKNTYTANDITTMSMSGDIMYMIAGEEIQAGAKVAYDMSDMATNGYIINNPKEETAGVITCGVALDKATSKGQLIRVQIL